MQLILPWLGSAKRFWHSQIRDSTILRSWNVSVVWAKALRVFLTAKSLTISWKSIRFASSDAQHGEIVQSSLANSASQTFLDEFQKLNANQASCVMIYVQVALKVSLSLGALRFNLTCLLISISRKLKAVASVCFGLSKINSYKIFPMTQMLSPPNTDFARP